MTIKTMKAYILRVSAQGVRLLVFVKCLMLKNHNSLAKKKGENCGFSCCHWLGRV